MGSISDAARTDARLISRLTDMAQLCEKYGCPRFGDFLDQRETAAAESWLLKNRVSARLYGGHSQAERCLVGIAPAQYGDIADDEFPLSRVAFQYRREADISHRQVLGALLSAGIRREKLGDILCGPGIAVVMAREEIVPFLVQQIHRIGGEGVSAAADYAGELPVFHRFSPLEGTVSSPRLDVIVKWLTNVSREPASEKIRSGLVSVNHCVCQDASRTIREKDILSIRGAGRFRIETIGPKTQKGRLKISAVQYI